MSVTCNVPPQWALLRQRAIIGLFTWQTDGKDFASSLDDDGLRVHTSQGVDGASPPSSDEEGENERAAGGG